MARKPRAASRSAREVWVVVVMRDLRCGGEGVVGGERVGSDVQIADPGIVGQHDGERWGGATSPEVLIEHVGHGTRTDGPSPECLREGGIDRGGAEAIGQGEQATGFGEEGMAALGEGLDEGGGVGAETAEAIAPAQLVRGPLHGRERREVGGVFDDLAVIVRADMVGELRGAIDEPDGVFIGDERERAADGLVWDRVVVAVEADVGGFSRRDGAHERAGKWVLREGQQAGLFLGEGLCDRPSRRIPRDGTAVRRLGDPRRELSIQIGDIRKPPGREEGVPEVLDGSLDFPLLIAPVRRTRFRGEVIVSRQLQEAGVVADVIAHAFEDDALQIVVQ